MEHSDSTLGVIEKWKRKCRELSSKHNDPMLIALTKGLEAVEVFVSKNSDIENVQRTLAYMKVERTLSLSFDKVKDDYVRDCAYGLLDIIHLMLRDLTEEKFKVKETEDMSTQTVEIPNVIYPFPIEPKEETVNQSDHVIENPGMEYMGDCSISKGDEMVDGDVVPHFTEPIEIKEESIEGSQDISLDNQIFDQDTMGEEFKYEEMENYDVNSQMDDTQMSREEEMLQNSTRNGLIENEGETSDVQMVANVTQPVESSEELMVDSQMIPIDNQNFQIGDISLDDERNNSMGGEIIGQEEEMQMELDNSLDAEMESPNNCEVKTGKRPSRGIAKPVNYSLAMENSDEDLEPEEKKLKSEKKIDSKKKSSSEGNSKPKSTLKKGLIRKENDTELECPECSYRSRSANAWEKHLSKKHSTTPALAGFAFLCACGRESLSAEHSRKCDSNYTVIRKRDGPILRVNEKTTPQCVLCEMYPKSLRGYIEHLSSHHQSTMEKNGIFLVCSCGFKYYKEPSSSARSSHKGCDVRRYTLHKLEEK